MLELRNLDLEQKTKSLAQVLTSREVYQPGTPVLIHHTTGLVKVICLSFLPSGDRLHL